eukprot:Rhum_TRINITY_DN19382_c0_g1::Rhum_TRINITY_DN19382_c0_g1_i1::g.169922::m.169922
MPKRSFNPNSHIYRFHSLFRPNPHALVGDSDLRNEGVGKEWSKNRLFRSVVSPYCRGWKWRSMRTKTGGHGWNACYKPLEMVKTEVRWSAAPEAFDFLSLPKTAFFDMQRNKPAHQRAGYTPKAEQVAARLTPRQRISEEAWEKVPVRQHSHTRSLHLDKAPTPRGDGRRGGLGLPKPNTFVEPARSRGSGLGAGVDGMNELAEALAKKRGTAGGGGGFFQVRAC